MQIKFPVGTSAENDQLNLPAGALTIDTERKAIRLFDGITQGGFEVVGEQAWFPPPEWVARPTQISYNWATGYSDGVWVTAGLNGDLSTSSDLLTWTKRTSGFGSSAIRDVGSGNDIIVVVGASGKISTSSDGGNTWVARSSGHSRQMFKVGFGGGLFVALADTGVTTSSDGITWTALTTGVSAALDCVSHANGLWVAGGRQGKIVTSPDGINWTQRASNLGTSNIVGVGYANDKWLAMSASGDVASSEDGITWTLNEKTYPASSASFFAGNGDQWLAVSGIETWYTDDGIMWTKTANNIGSFCRSISYGGGYWSAGGDINYMTLPLQ